MNSLTAPAGSLLCMRHAENASSSWSHRVTLQAGYWGQGARIFGFGSREQQQLHLPVNEKTSNKLHLPIAHVGTEKENFSLLMTKTSLGEDEAQKRLMDSYTRSTRNRIKREIWKEERGAKKKGRKEIKTD